MGGMGGGMSPSTGGGERVSIQCTTFIFMRGAPQTNKDIIINDRSRRRAEEGNVYSDN
jgi:hypothetical protein